MNGWASCAYGGGVVQSDDRTGPSLNLINRNVPQSNVTEPNKSNVVTVTVFGNLYEEKDTTDIAECVRPPACRLSYRLLATFLPEKQRLSPAKNFYSPSVCDEKKISTTISPLDRDFSELSENSLRPARLTRGYTLPSRLFRSPSAGFLCEFTAEIFRSVWITISGELANRGCGFYVSSPGSSSLWVNDHRRRIGEPPVVLMWRLCVKGATYCYS